MGDLKPNEQRAKNAIILIWIVLALEIVNLMSSYLQYDLFQIVANGEDISDEAATANDSREQIVGFLYLIASIVSAVTFIMWFRRAYFNLHQKINYLSHSESRAASSWFIPIICLYQPYQIMKELYVETKKLLLYKGFSEQVNYTTSYLGWWWALWIISNFVGYFIFKFVFRHADTVDDYIMVTVFHMGLSIIGIPLALITIIIIKDYSEVESLLMKIQDDKVPEENDSV